MPFEIRTIETPELGDRSYAILAGDQAVVIDPQRDIDRVLAVLAEHGNRLSHVLETHIHNDYVSGGPELCRVTGATHVIPAGEAVGYERQSIADGETLHAGDLAVTALHTPGHAVGHLCFEVAGVFTATHDQD